MTHVRIIYFKENGKYYSEGEIDLPDVVVATVKRPLHFFEAVELIKQMFEAGKRPGLVDGHEFNALVTIYTPDGPLPFLYVRKR